MVVVGGLVVAISWRGWWGHIGTWLVAQSTVTLAVAIPAALALVAAGVSFAGLRRVVP